MSKPKPPTKAEEAKLTKAMRREANARTRRVTVTPQKLNSILERAEAEANNSGDDK